MKRIGKNETTEMAPVKKCFVGLETALYLLFLALDAFSAGGDGVKYLTIVVCLLAAVWSARHGGSRLMAWAMAFTLAADTFLLLLDRWYGAGIVLFCVVQGLYLARIRRACGRTLWALRTGLVPAAWVLLNALGMGTALNLLAALYFVNFLVNACQSLTLRSERLFAAGLWLFLLCDVCVGLRNQPSLLPGLAGAAQAGMWLFYLPGQVLLVRGFYTVQIGPLGICEASGLTRRQAAEAYGDVMDYCMGRRPDFAAGVLPFSQEGASHFADVRVLFLLDIRLLAVSLAALLALYLLRRRKGMALCRFGGRGPGFWAACGLGGLFVIVGGLAALDFDRAFAVFHTIFFPGKDNWLFDPMTDPVILILPEEYFRSCALLILAGLLLACGVLIAADLRRRRR